jgi:hypothetical protein
LILELFNGALTIKELCSVKQDGNMAMNEKRARFERSWSKPISRYNQYTGCDKIRYTILKIYCDQMDSNITTQFLTEHLLTLQDFLQVFNMTATGYAADIQTIF